MNQTIESLKNEVNRLCQLANEFDESRPVCDNAPNPYNAEFELATKTLHEATRNYQV